LLFSRRRKVQGKKKQVIARGQWTLSAVDMEKKTGSRISPSRKKGKSAEVKPRKRFHFERKRILGGSLKLDHCTGLLASTDAYPMQKEAREKECTIRARAKNCHVAKSGKKVD